MTKITSAKKNRIEGRMYDPPAMGKFVMCRVCRRPMRVSPGQIALYHKVCRPYRNKTYGPSSIIKPRSSGRKETGARDRVNET